MERMQVFQLQNFYTEDSKYTDSQGRHLMKKIANVFLLITFSISLGCGTGPQKLQLRKIPRNQRKAMMVLNFKNITSKSRASEFQSWEFGIPSMLMTDLEAIGVFNLITRDQIREILKEQELQMTGITDPEQGVKIGKIAAARYMLSGTFLEVNGNLRIESRVYSVETGTQLGAASVSGRTDSFFDLEKKLILKVMAFLDTMLSEEEQAKLATNIETKSVRASLNNYQGELSLIKADELKSRGLKEEADKIIQNAKSDFQNALKYDPNYERAKENLSKISLAIPVTL